MSIREALGLPMHTNLKAHRTYRIWFGAKYRCESEKATNHDKYLGRGITMCDRWLGKRGFLNFLDDMGHPPTNKHSLERVDNNGPYSPDNCVWATAAEQANNKRNCIPIEYKGETVTLAIAAALAGLPYGCVYQRFKRGIRGDLLFLPSDKRNRVRTTPLINPNSKSGIKGVYRTRCGNWSACIRRNKVRHHLGTFTSKDDAANAVQRFMEAVKGDDNGNRDQ